MSTPNILAFAYACEPGKGSEPGAGWAMARVAARIGPTWVITRANNREAIEMALPTVPEQDRLNFVYVDLPQRLIRWKRGKRGVHLYYLLWQFAALRCARSLLRQQRFNLVWHVTIANIWLGSAAPLTDLPFVYGPVGGGVGTSWKLLPSVGAAGSVFEVSRSVARAASRHLNPLCGLAMRRAQVILVQNEETLNWVPASLRDKAVVEPNAIVDAQPPERAGRGDRPPTALFAGELIPLKGVALAIRAIALAPEWRLLICGKGADERRLRAMADRLRGQRTGPFPRAAPTGSGPSPDGGGSRPAAVSQPPRRGAHGCGRSAHRGTAGGVSGSRRSARVRWHRRSSRKRAPDICALGSRDEDRTGAGSVLSLLARRCESAIRRSAAKPWFTR